VRLPLGALLGLVLVAGLISVQDGSLSRMDSCGIATLGFENILNLSQNLAPIDALVCIIAHEKIRISS